MPFFPDYHTLQPAQLLDNDPYLCAKAGIPEPMKSMCTHS